MSSAKATTEQPDWKFGFEKYKDYKTVGSTLRPGRNKP